MRSSTCCAQGTHELGVVCKTAPEAHSNCQHTSGHGIATQYGEQVENILYTPFITLEEMSINEVEFNILPGHQAMTSPVRCFISLSYDGVTYGKEYTQTTSEQFIYDLRLIFRQLGYVRQYAGLKLRTVSGERLAISRCMLEYS